MKESVDVEQPWQAPVFAPRTNINNLPPQTDTVYILGEDIPDQEPLPCWGLGVGWTLFILGFLLCAVPWYVGGCLPWCVLKDKPREKLGCTFCLIAGNLFTVFLCTWFIISMP